MKKFILLTTVICLILSALVACSNNVDDPADITAAGAETQTETESETQKSVVDKYDKYRGDSTTAPESSETLGNESDSESQAPGNNSSGFGEEIDWENGTILNY